MCVCLRTSRLQAAVGGCATAAAAAAAAVSSIFESLDMSTRKKKSLWGFFFFLTRFAYKNPIDFDSSLERRCLYFSVLPF